MIYILYNFNSNFKCQHPCLVANTKTWDSFIYSETSRFLCTLGTTLCPSKSLYHCFWRKKEKTDSCSSTYSELEIVQDLSQRAPTDKVMTWISIFLYILEHWIKSMCALLCMYVKKSPFHYTLMRAAILVKVAL